MISKIEASVRTGQQGTNGKVYLGIGGREFLLDAKGNDFRPNQTNLFVLGVDTNYRGNAALVNNPTSPPLDEANLNLFPIYLRFDGTGIWAVGPVTVRVFVDDQLNAAASTFVNPLGLSSSGSTQFLTLGDDRGRVCFLRPQ